MISAGRAFYGSQPALQRSDGVCSVVGLVLVGGVASGRVSMFGLEEHPGHRAALVEAACEGRCGVLLWHWRFGDRFQLGRNAVRVV